MKRVFHHNNEAVVSIYSSLVHLDRSVNTRWATRVSPSRSQRKRKGYQAVECEQCGHTGRAEWYAVVHFLNDSAIVYDGEASGADWWWSDSDWPWWP